MSLPLLFHILIILIVTISMICITVLMFTLCQLCFKCTVGCFKDPPPGPPPRNSVFMKFEMCGDYADPRRRESQEVKEKKTCPVNTVKRNNTKRYSIQYKKILKQRKMDGTKETNISLVSTVHTEPEIAFSSFVPPARMTIQST